MIISMQGNWNVTVKSKNAAFEQQFIVSGAITGNGAHPGVPGTSVNVTGKQWSIAIKANPGAGFQLSDTKIKFPAKVGGNYVFDIGSNDSGGDADFDDLILTCSTPATINDFIIYGHVSVYSGCIFNPCRKGPYVIETPGALRDALKNKKIRELLEKLYPERVPGPVIPNPPDPPYFKPIVIDLFGQAMQPKTVLEYRSIDNASAKTNVKAAEARELTSALSLNNFQRVQSSQTTRALSSQMASQVARDSLYDAKLAGAIDNIFRQCHVDPATNVTLTFEEYDRTAAELAGGAYTGTGDRQLLGDAITDMSGNYIFRFTFDMTFPGIADALDQAPGENIDVVAYPDVIVKILGFSPGTVLYESAPHYDIPNLKRINLCLPADNIPATSACFNGNLIGSLGNVFIGGNQNSAASFSNAALRRYGYNNHLEANGKISVNSSLAGFNIECAAWRSVIDIKGCMYDTAKTVAQNTIKWYTLRIMRAGSGGWEFVSQNYKHPKFSKRNLPNYTGDDVGSFPTSLHVDGGAAVLVPAYKNIQREIFVDGIDWEFSNFDRYMQLNTGLYDKLIGVTTPGTFYVRVDCYDAGGNPVPSGTDMIALFINNLALGFQLTGPMLTDPAIVHTSCGLYRLTDAQMNTPLQLSFKANDEYGFVHSYALTMGRCPDPMLALRVNSPNPPLSNTATSATTLAHGDAAGNVHNTCNGYTGTYADFSDPGLITVEVQPDPIESGWIKADEYFTVLTFALSADQRVTNGYNTGLSGEYHTSASIYLERLNP
jgi:hypothetical protein